MSAILAGRAYAARPGCTRGQLHGNARMHPAQLPCWITHTNARTHELVRGWSATPTFGDEWRAWARGTAQASKTRSCGLLVKTAIRCFGTRRVNHAEFCVNGITTSLPFDTQVELVHSIAGLENAHIMRPGYGIEYDYFDPRGLRAALKPGRLTACFCGQINGTTGYEEAAAQGLFCWIACRIACTHPGAPSRSTIAPQWASSIWLPRRDEAYLGYWWMT